MGMQPGTPAPGDLEAQGLQDETWPKKITLSNDLLQQKNGFFWGEKKYEIECERILIYHKKPLQQAPMAEWWSGQSNREMYFFLTRDDNWW